MRAGGDCGVRGPGKVCAAWRVGQGRQRRMRPAIIAVGGRACATGRRAARDGTTARKERERGTVGEKEKMDTTNGIRCWNDERSWKVLGLEITELNDEKEFCFNMFSV